LRTHHGAALSIVSLFLFITFLDLFENEILLLTLSSRILLLLIFLDQVLDHWVGGDLLGQKTIRISYCQVHTFKKEDLTNWEVPRFGG